MSTYNWKRRALLAGVWAMAVSTWAAIGHHLFGLVDLGPLAVAVSVIAIMAWPRGRRWTAVAAFRGPWRASAAP